MICVREGNPAGEESASPSACLDEAGSLLRALTTSPPQGRIGEVGTGAGVGAPWMAAGLADTAALITAELDARLAGATRDLFASYNNVEVITGDWRDVMPQRAPFDLLFFDGGGPDARRRCSSFDKLS